MKEIKYNRRMYAGYPVFLITYYDKDNKRFNYATSSSMYTLGKMAMIGLGNSNAKKCILETKEFTVSFISKKYITDVENGGTSGQSNDKFSTSNLTMDTIDNISYIKEAELVYKLTLVENFQSEDFPKYSNLVCNIGRVFANDNIVIDDYINVDKYDPLIFIGTDQGRFFKSLKNKS